MLEFTKYLIYASFILNIACGVWVLTGIVQWIAEMNKKNRREPLGEGAFRPREAPLPPNAGRLNVPHQPKGANMNGGRLYYDMPIGILCLESLFPKPRGHMRNPLTYGFPTVTRVIRGVDIPRLLFNPTPDLLEPFIQAAKELEADGVQAITGSCGFMARFQNQIAAELHIPVFLSSLLQLPLVRLMHGEKAEIGVLTASSQALTPAHFANCATPMESVHIRGMEGNPEFWETIIEGKRHDFDMERLEAEIVGSAAAFAREKALDALVLECTDLSAFSAPIQRAINLPVYDINSLVEYAYYAVCRKDY